jgi:hypothetical protein
MEKNTFATSAYIGVDTHTAFQYLADPKNLGEWTLSSKMREQVDSNTWIGTASGYQHPLYYHVHTYTGLPFPGVEWQCGAEYKQYYHIYPMFLFPSNYIEPGTADTGTYFHWVSFVGQKRRTKLIMEGIDLVHTSETRALKAVIERTAGLRAPAQGRYKIKTTNIYVDAPFEMLVEYLSNLENIRDWGHLARPDGPISSERGNFLNEYAHPLETQVRTHRFSDVALIEYDSVYQKTGLYVRVPALVIPCSRAFGEPSAQGCILHRLTFVPTEESLIRIYPQEDIGAENLNIKRIVEERAGNLTSMAQGMSYIARENV